MGCQYKVRCHLPIRTRKSFPDLPQVALVDKKFTEKISFEAKAYFRGAYSSERGVIWLITFTSSVQVSGVSVQVSAIRSVISETLTLKMESPQERFFRHSDVQPETMNRFDLWQSRSPLTWPK